MSDHIRDTYRYGPPYPELPGYEEWEQAQGRTRCTADDCDHAKADGGRQPRSRRS